MITPIFRIFDVEKAQEFYLDYLDFQLDWQHQFGDNMPLYLQISKNKIVLHLSEHHGDASPGGSIRIKIQNVKDYHDYLSKKGYRYANPGIEKTAWNTIEFYVTDPFSNKIIFYEECK
ncbi:glyoxalase superfamily protein [Sporosarcina thermotolerans]|uniref:Bleomycin resistance protein n=1 Tax=Sporosarcina thermotolerans TaxID=633404 RepID=A0AAW9A9H1_9BACL|nr:glyoxalase superfamily protein [Sporosarcina thermotolerans]MDW0118291.1 glyoxalase superfamily protein [Sporosarcina thermotolerans]WHT48603.1 glyoxalase superfamily protein [Sporosarcina thermotolerans]